MQLKGRKVIAGAMSVANGFPIEGVVESVMVTLSAPDGRKFEVPLDLKIYENVDEYKQIADEFWHNIKKLDEQP